MKNKAGFTLIEITVSLVLVGLIASIAGTSVIMGMRGYLFAKENDVITQKAQLAMNRLNREFMELMDIKAVNDTQPYVIYEVPLRAGGVEKRAIAKVGSKIRIYFDAEASPPFDEQSNTGATLVDRVQNFSILYNGAAAWTSDIRQLYAVGIQMDLSRPDTGGAVSFSTTVSPRNNNNAGGASVPTASNPPPEYSGRQCFVTTAAWGDPDHPVVEVLRQFRDRVLLQSAVGMAVIRYYYEVGPSLAAAIEDKPFACLIVRLLVLPAAGFAFLALSCPILIPFILLFSWGSARLILGELRRRSPRWSPRLQGQRGAMLVTLIATMVLFSTLGALMIGMFGTSALSQASGNISTRAYYLAESGFRYAASSYVNVSGADELTRDTTRDNLLVNELHGKTFSLNSGYGQFRIDVYPYYYKVVEAPTTNMLKTRVPGGLPIPALELAKYDNAWVKVTKTDGNILFAQISSASMNPVSGFTEVRFYILSGSWDTAIDVNSVVTPICKANATTATLTRTEDGKTKYDLAFQSPTGAGIFPEKNGIVSVIEQGTAAVKTLGYKKLDLVANKLVDVYDPDGISVPPTVQPGSNIVLSKFIRLESTGTVGTGSSAVSRKVTYYSPVGYAKATPIPKTEFKETFDDATLANWFTGTHGSHIGAQLQSSSIGPALQFGSGAVTKTAAGTRYYEGQIGLNWSAANIPFATEWVRASKYLSYDLQAKLYFAVTATKRAAGPTFRLDESGNAIGLSYGVLDQGLDIYGRDKDFIPDPIVSSGSVSNPVITLWAKQYNKADNSFTVVSNPSTGPTECTGHPDSALSPYAISSPNSAVWETGFRVRFTPSGGAALPGNLAENTDYFARRIEGTNYVYLFDSFYNAIAKDGSTPACWLWDGVRKITSTGSGTITAVNQDPAWTNLAYQELTTSNSAYGLYSTATGNLVPWSTFLVRIIEAPSVSVLSTAGSTGREIISGDTVYTTSDNSSNGTVTAIALVRRNPVYRSSSSTVRNWPGKTAEAVLILEPVKDTNGDTRSHVFGQGKTLFAGVEGAGVNAGVVGLPSGSTDIVYRDRDQWIAVYVADPTGPASSRIPDTDPFNIYNTSTHQYLRGRILRTSVRWPVDDVEYTNAANDFFTVVRFASYVNSTLPSCRVNGLELGGTNCLGGFYSGNNLVANYPDILRFSSPDGVVFNSPAGTTFPTARPEVGLHNLGGNIPSFDDFAIQFGPGYGITRQGFHLPIQQ
jgi:prepilin-type N-terminal cleavage/methylation domain-containing protein